MLHILNYSAQTARLEGLDALRGFALMGILLVNFPEVVGVHEIRPDGQVYQWLDFLIEGHFFPLFCLLFAIGFGMMWRTAPLRTSRPRFALVRRLLLLGILGVLHSQLQPSEVLLLYALFGFFILIPMTFLPPAKWARWILFIIGALLIAVGGWVGGWMLIAGLFVVGFLAGQARIPERIASSTHTRRVSAFIALACAALSLFGFWLKQAVENGNASATPRAAANPVDGCRIRGHVHHPAAYPRASRIDSNFRTAGENVTDELHYRHTANDGGEISCARRMVGIGYGSGMDHYVRIMCSDPSHAMGLV